MATLAATKTPVSLKPLALVVKAPHLKSQRNMQEAQKHLQEFGNVTYVRDLFISLATTLYNPTNIYLDGIIEAETGVIASGADYYNSLLQEIAGGLRDYFKDRTTKPQFPDPEKVTQDMLRGGNGYQISLKGMRNGIIKNALKRFGPNYGEGSICLEELDIDRQVRLLSLSVYYDFDLKICPAEQSLELFIAQTEADQKGDMHLSHSIVAERDKRLYQRLLADLQCSPPSQARNAIIYLGDAHSMTQLRQAKQFDAAFVDVRKSTGSAVEISGTLPCQPDIGEQPEALATHKAGIAGWLQSGPIPVVVNLDYRLRQLKEK